jgi:acyl-CoA synthetase (AMP-forming)/AMP-acid ligase II
MSMHCSRRSIVIGSVVSILAGASNAQTVHAEVVLKEGAKVTSEELIEHVKGRVGRFKAPKAVVSVEQLPVSVVGKVLRRHVRDKYWKDQARRVS